MIRRSAPVSCFSGRFGAVFAALIILAPAGALAAEQVSVRSLLRQMVDLGFLARRPSPYFKAAQASSYDRAAKSPTENWFANADAGQFIRTEQNGGRTEYVMADLKGPGAVVRIWSANPGSTVRFYFDGETNPRFSAKLADLLNGRVAPLGDPFGYDASSGTNLYFPFPYAKSLKITADNSDNNAAAHLYYHVGYRTYALGTSVKTFTTDEFMANAALIDEVGSALLRRQPKAYPVADKLARSETLQPGKTLTAPLNGAGAIQELQVKIPFPLVQTIREMDWDDPHQPHNVLRNLLIRIEFDGERSVDAPLGDFFGAAPGLNPMNSLPLTIAADGTMTCRFPMPFKKSATVSIENVGKVPVPVSVQCKVGPWRFGPDTYTFHAQWVVERGSSRPMRDMTMLHANGEGMWAGVHLNISNPNPAWWGEGDEKVYVDGETFPSTFGTGSEDYFGYAWGSPQLFDRPYHGQPRCDGPGSFGYTSVHRWQLFDPITYERNLRFDMELWHWAVVETTVARTSYWYAKPGGTGPVAVNQSLLLPVEIHRPEGPKGALEGEELTIASKSGGETSIQEGFFELSKGKQLWWVEPKAGDKLVLKIPVKEAGRYEVVGNFCHARDYGIHRIRINGKDVGRDIDFFIPDGVEWKKISLGTFDLPAGDVLFEVQCVGHREGAVPSNMFGLDYLLLNRQ